MLSTDKIIPITKYDSNTDTAEIVYEIPVRIRAVSLLSSRIGTSTNSEVTIIKSGLQDTISGLEKPALINWLASQYTATTNGLLVSGAGVVNLAVTAAGTTNADATALSLQFNIATTVASGTGVKLPVITPLAVFIVINNGANALKVYPAVSDYIGSNAQNAGVTLAVGAKAVFYAKSSAVAATAGYGWVQLV
jgi:hypothetical protein